MSLIQTLSVSVSRQQCFCFRSSRPPASQRAFTLEIKFGKSLFVEINTLHYPIITIVFVITFIYVKVKLKMSKVTKRKHVMNEALWDDYELPKDNQIVVKVLKSKGNNLHEVSS